MAHIIEIKTFSDDRGDLRVIQDQIPFSPERVYYIHSKPGVTRGGHRHRETDQILVCVHGQCTVSSNDGTGFKEYVLDNPSRLLFIDRKDWHTMHSFSEESVLLVLASKKYDLNDYIDEPYPEH